MSGVKGTPILENGPTMIRTVCGHTIYGVLTDVEEETQRIWCYNCKMSSAFKVIRRSRIYTEKR